MIPPELQSLVLRAVEETTGVMIIGSGLERVYVNQRAAEILGWPREELEKKSLLEILAPEEVPRIADLVRAWHEGNEVPRTVETVYLGKDGRRIPVSASRVDLEHEGRTYTFAFYTDISERVRAQQALAASELRFRQFAEASPDTITVIADGKFVYANPAAVRALGFSNMDDFIARPLAELLEPQERAVMGERMARVRAGESLPPREYAGRRKDGSTIALEISSIAIDLDGKPAILAFGRDLSDRKAIEAELVRAERMATIGTLAAGVAHEINNPMAYVMLNLEQLRNRLATKNLAAPEASELQELIDDSIDGCERVASITRQLLMFSRPERAPAAVDASVAMEAALKLAASPVRRTARVDKRVEGAPAVRGEERRITQVFLNLLLNAVESFGDRPIEENAIDVWLRADDEEVVVDISDNGAGVRAANLDRIFEPFFTTKTSGTGLGLAISRSIVESFGGRLEALARPEGGTTFRVRLLRANVAPTGTPRSGGAQATRRASIVLVDDEPLVATALAAMLREKHDVSGHTSAREALARLERGPLVDVVICDLAMPELSGMDLFSRLCGSRPEYAERFVFVTGGTTTPEAAAFVAEVAARTLPKPFDMDEVEAAIDDCLARAERR